MSMTHECMQTIYLPAVRPRPLPLFPVAIHFSLFVPVDPYGIPCLTPERESVPHGALHYPT